MLDDRLAVVVANLFATARTGQRRAVVEVYLGLGRDGTREVRLARRYISVNMNLFANRFAGPPMFFLAMVMAHLRRGRLGRLTEIELGPHFEALAALARAEVVDGAVID